MAVQVAEVGVGDNRRGYGDSGGIGERGQARGIAEHVDGVGIGAVCQPGRAGQAPGGDCAIVCEGFAQGHGSLVVRRDGARWRERPFSGGSPDG